MDKLSTLTFEVRSVVEPLWWNNLVQKVSSGTIFHSTEWGDYLRDMGAEVLFFLARDRQGGIAGILLAWTEPILGLQCGRWPKLHRMGRPILPRRAFWFYGPLVFSLDQATVANQFHIFVDKFFKKRKVVSLCGLSPFHDRLGISKTVDKLSPFSDEPRATFIIDLTQNLDIRWRSMKSSARKAVKRCQRNSVFVERLKDGDIPQYEALLQESTSRHHHLMPPHFPNTTMWKSLRQAQPHVEVFIARKDSRLLGGLGVLIFNGILFEIAVARGIHSFTEDLPVQDLIKWAIICWGHQEGHRLYDLSGVSPTPSTAKDRGIRQFKAKWGGEYIEYPAFSKNYSLAYSVGSWARHKASFLFKHYLR